MRRRALSRLAIREARHRKLDPHVEEERLSHERSQAGQERGVVARARRARRDAPDSLALGARPCRYARQPSRGRARESRRFAGAWAARVMVIGVPPRLRLRRCAAPRGGGIRALGRPGGAHPPASARSMRRANTVISFSAWRSPFWRAMTIPL